MIKNNISVLNYSRYLNEINEMENKDRDKDLDKYLDKIYQIYSNSDNIINKNGYDSINFYGILFTI